MRPLPRCTFTLLSLAATLIAAPVQARPAHKQALVEYFGSYLPKQLNDCRTCHLPDKPDDAGADSSKKPHNSFGARLAAVKKELSKAGKPTSIAARLAAIADEDSDGDGVSNVLELLSGHFPGDPTDKPTAVELARTRDTLAAFLKSKNGYAWTPFETVRRPALPAVKNASWVRNPVDAFIAAEQEQRGLTPRPTAPPAVLLRRVYLDLTGLPPTPDELHAFLADPSAEAYEKVVDRLLASPRYGERWGRHWMDIWRYSDWAGWGAQVRDSQPHIWHWRDWIIESLNADKGYDRMIVEMLAADELTPNDPDTLRATGYLVRNYKLLSREKWMQDTVEHTSQAFLGVTLGCARCHDHMYDPILQKEYYQVRAIFEPHQVRIDRLPGQPDLAKNGLPRAYDANLEVPTVLFIRGDDRTPDKTPLPPGVPEALGGRFHVEPVSLPRTVSSPDKREFVVQETVAASEASREQAQATLRAAWQNAVGVVSQTTAGSPVLAAGRIAAARKTLDALALAEVDAPLAEARHAALLAVLRVEKREDNGGKDTEEWKQAATEAATLQRPVVLLEARRNLLAAQQAQRDATEQTRPETAKKLAAAEKALARAEADSKLPPTTAYTKRPIAAYPAMSTGRRLAFAQWIANRQNPLTARVAMNHIWLRHFGQPLVPTVFDFGRNGRPPSHPALLDWLAAELMERGWSMKEMHRLLVTSNTYRLASTPDAADLALDRDNRCYWRMPSRQVEAEVVRDCVFYVAGQLDLTMGGPDIDQLQGLTVQRRSLYFRHAQEKQMEFLKIFDTAAVTECYRRKESIVPQQALALVNSELTLRQARLLARALAQQSGTDGPGFVTAAFERVLSRPPTAEELAECAAFLEQQTQRYTKERAQTAGTDPALRARENLVHVLLNHNDFVTVR